MERTETQMYAPSENRSSILDSISPQGDIDKILSNLLGLKTVPRNEKGKTIYISVRASKPEFTEEYVRDLASDLSQFLNFTVQVSRFEQRKINQKVGHYLLSLTQDLATHGDDNYISDDTWHKILAVHEQYIVIDGEQRSGWYRFGINWTYNSPVTFDMIKLVKDFDEEKDQGVKFSKHISTFGTLIEASLSKSFSSQFSDNGMIARLLGEVRTESSTLRNEEQTKGGFSFLKPQQTEEKIKW